MAISVVVLWLLIR
jgi:hypothetical protein